LNGVAVGRLVGMGLGVFVEGINASVVATASSTGRLGVVVFVGREQDVNMNRITILNKNCLMRRLYRYSEQFYAADVLRVKE
jgi:hypothetical protein